MFFGLPRVDGRVVVVFQRQFFGIFIGFVPLRQVQDEGHEDEGCKEHDCGVFDPCDAGGAHVVLPLLFFEGHAQSLQVGDQRVHFGFVFERIFDARHVCLGVGLAQFHFGADAFFGEGDVGRGGVQPGVGWHVRFGYDAARVGEVAVVPVVIQVLLAKVMISNTVSTSSLKKRFLERTKMSPTIVRQNVKPVTVQVPNLGLVQSLVAVVMAKVLSMLIPKLLWA